MSKRLQVLISDKEYETIKRLAGRQGIAIGEWIRSLIRKEASERDVKPAEIKLAALQKALQYSFPAPDIDQMNREIEEGYRRGLP